MTTAVPDIGKAHRFGSTVEEKVAKAIYGETAGAVAWADLEWTAQHPYFVQARAALNAMHANRHLLDREHIIEFSQSKVADLTRFLKHPSGSHRPVPDLVFEAGGHGVMVRTFPWTEHRNYEETHRGRPAT